MIRLIIKVILRKFLVWMKIFGSRKNILLVLIALVIISSCWWFVLECSRVFQPPLPPLHNLEHFKRNRSLEYYLSRIQVLIEPSQSACGSLDDVPVIVLVSSAPSRFEHRQAVRQTWAKYQPTYFVLGLHGDNVDEQLVDNYIEAKQYSDLVVFDFRDHYQNLTLKTALMMKWTLDQCPQAQFFFKTDDDVMLNPWTFRKVLEDHIDNQLIGYRIEGVKLHRDEYNKWYVPRWLYFEDRVDMYLSGTGYLINGDFLPGILKKAYHIPMVNLEDIYFTYLVAHKALGYKLSHDRRLSPFKPWLKMTCVYLDFASIHSLEPDEMLSTWSKIQHLANVADSSKGCVVNSYFGQLSSFAVF